MKPRRATAPSKMVSARRYETRGGGRPLSITHFGLTRQWHPTKNGDLTPANITEGSHRKVWWRCGKNDQHDWQAIVKSRTRAAGTGCPFCWGRVVTPDKSLAQIRRLMRQWHPTKNKGIDPRTITPRTDKKFWWKCRKGPDHEWRADPLHRNRSDRNPGGCPFCAGKRVSVTNSLATRFPKIAQEWHPQKNGALSAADVVAGARRKVWWLCAKIRKHEWMARIEARTRLGNGCPLCVIRGVPENYRLVNVHPDIAYEWDSMKNRNLELDRIAFDSYRGVWWRCKARHSFRETIFYRTQVDDRCPMCS